MKGPAAGLSFVLIAVGALLIWSGFQGVSLLATTKSVLAGEKPAAGTKGDATSTKPGDATNKGDLLTKPAETTTRGASTSVKMRPVTQEGETR